MKHSISFREQGDKGSINHGLEVDGKDGMFVVTNQRQFTIDVTC